MIAKVPKSEAAHFTKNLLLKNKKSGEFFLLLCFHDTPVDLKGFGKYLKTKPDNIRGADLDTLKSMLGCEKGAVNVLSLINDSNNKVAVYVDDKIDQLASDALLCAHPMQNNATIEITKEVFYKVIELSGHKSTSVNFESLKVEKKEAPKHSKEEEKKIDHDTGRD